MSPDKADRPGFVETQYAFAAHIRDPEQTPGPQDVEDRRMAIYRELFFNNVESFLSGTFPVLHKLMDEEAWLALARDFYKRHHCHSPLFLEIPREFLTYLEEEREPQPADPPFLRELAHYEWVELALSVAEEEEAPVDVAAEGDLLEGAPVLSSVAWPLTYQYPVHQIRPEFQPDAPGEQPTYLLVYRDAEDEVGFLELNPVRARLFALLSDPQPLSGRGALERIAQELQHPDPEVVIQGGLGILAQWRDKGIVLGTRLA